MTEHEHRQDDRSEGYCPLCREQVTTVYVDAAGWCSEHGRVWVEWNPPRVPLAVSDMDPGDETEEPR